MSYLSTTKEYKNSIHELKAKMANLETQKNLRYHEGNLLISYAKTLSGQHIQPDQFSTFLDTFVERGRNNIDAVSWPSLF
jgi:hypothetical protein